LSLERSRQIRRMHARTEPIQPGRACGLSSEGALKVVVVSTCLTMMGQESGGQPQVELEKRGSRAKVWIVGRRGSVTSCIAHRAPWRNFLDGATQHGVSWPTQADQRRLAWDPFVMLFPPIGGISRRRDEPWGAQTASAHGANALECEPERRQNEADCDGEFASCSSFFGSQSTSSGLVSPSHDLPVRNLLLLLCHDLAKY
jgi:hypothetical protein